MALSRVSKHRRLPRSITVDHGTEFTSRAFDKLAWENGVRLDFTRPGKPTDNGLCESFNGRLRDECLNVHEFESMEHGSREARSLADRLQRTAPARCARQPDPERVRQIRSVNGAHGTDFLVQNCPQTGANITTASAMTATSSSRSGPHPRKCIMNQNIAEGVAPHHCVCNAVFPNPLLSRKSRATRAHDARRENRPTPSTRSS